jgi:type III restriction enzyme
MFEITEQLRTAPCVPAIREALKLWRSENYKGVTETTNELLNFWFKTDHRLANGQRFKFHAAQQEAIETKVAD